MLNRNELKAEMARNGHTQKTLAAAIGVSERTFSSKMKKGNFGMDEMDAIIEILKIKNPTPIFFRQSAT